MCARKELALEVWRKELREGSSALRAFGNAFSSHGLQYSNTSPHLLIRIALRIRVK